MSISLVLYSYMKRVANIQNSYYFYFTGFPSLAAYLSVA